MVAELYKYICSREHWIKRKFDSEQEKATYENMAGLGRFYITYLTYKQWRRDLGEKFDPHADSPALISATKSLEIYDQFTERVASLPDIAVESLLAVRNQNNLETRTLLRQGAHRTLIESTFDAFYVGYRAALKKIGAT